MRQRAEWVGLGILLSLGLAGCGAPSPVAPTPANAPSTEAALPQEIDLTSGASTSGTYEVQQYYRDMGGGMRGPTRGVTPTYRVPIRRGPVFVGGIPYTAPPISWRPSWQQVREAQLRARAREAADIQRMARWQAIQEAVTEMRYTVGDLQRQLSRTSDPAARNSILNRIRYLQMRIGQGMREMYFPSR